MPTGYAVALQEHFHDKLNQKWRLLTICHEGVLTHAWMQDGQGTPIANSGLVASGLSVTRLSGLAFGATSLMSPDLLSQALSQRLKLAVQSSEEENGNLATTYANAFTA